MFNIEATDAARLLQRHRDASAFLSEAVQGTPRHAELKDEMRKLFDVISRFVRVEIVDPANTGILEQLIGKDDVHDFGVRSVDELREYRIAERGGNKMCVAAVNPFTPSRVPQVLSAIYVNKQIAPIPILEYEGMNGHAKPVYDYRALEGDVDKILHTRCNFIDALVSALIFYSITNIKMEGTNIPVLKGSGEILINRLFGVVETLIAAGELPQNIVTSTLSPLRAMRSAWKKSGYNLDTADDHTMTMLAVALLMQGVDGVQRFHGGNGIDIGDIKLRANTPQSLDGIKGAGVMVNYVYRPDPAERAARQQLFRARKFDQLLAPHLRPYLRLISQDLRTNMAP